MSRLVYIRGVSHHGFRVKDNTGAWKVSKKGVNVRVDLDDESTKKILSRQRDQYVVVAGSGTTTAIITGLERNRGFRIRRNGDEVLKSVTKGGVAVTVDLNNGRALRTLRRSPGRYIRLVSTSDTSVKVRGIQGAQLGFDVGTTGTGVLTSDNVNVSNNDTVTIGGRVYTFKTNLTEVRATAVLTSDNTEVVDGDTVTINNRTYRFKTTPVAVGDIKRSGTVDTTLGFLAAAINQSGLGDGSDYFAGTLAPTNVTSSAVASHALTLTAAVGTGILGNAYASTETSIHLSFVGTTFSGGIAPVADQIHISGSADASLTNLASAINGTGGTVGTDYSSGTTANAVVSSSAVASHALTLTSLAGGDKVNITTTEASTHLSFGATTIVGTISKVKEGTSVTVILDAVNVGQLRRHFKSWVEDTN